MTAQPRDANAARPNDYAPREPRDYLWNQLAELPYFRALLRAVESRFYADLPMVGPVLDLGSGDGSFAAQTFGRPLDVGLDPWKPPMAEARRRGAHAALTLADAARMPFSDASFNTVISNSVLEHIPEIEPVVAETFRVLKPGGHFIFARPAGALLGCWGYPRQVVSELVQRIARVRTAVERPARSSPPG
jgi:ubiquinone/menaquinone biosynthesis C-methylase UbiE